jgi:hypothetical protein
MITILDQFIPGPGMITIFRHFLYITKISVLEQLKSIVFLPFVRLLYHFECRKVIPDWQ